MNCSEPDLSGLGHIPTSPYSFILCALYRKTKRCLFPTKETDSKLRLWDQRQHDKKPLPFATRQTFARRVCLPSFFSPPATYILPYRTELLSTFLAIILFVQKSPHFRQCAQFLLFLILIFATYTGILQSSKCSWSKKQLVQILQTRIQTHAVLFLPLPTQDHCNSNPNKNYS